VRKLTIDDIANITGISVEGYRVKRVRVKRGPFADSDHYGIILGWSDGGHYVTWEFHLDDDERVNPYWGHYYMGDREAAIRDYDTRDLNVDKGAVWGEYQRYLRGWADDHGGSDYYGMSPAGFDEWYGNEYQNSEGEHKAHGLNSYRVTITETLKRAIIVDASDQSEAEQIISDGWHNSEYILDADNFYDVEFTAAPVEEREDNANGS
jgi:hypothetical protein